ncbi:MAG TPA: hypothetical protein VMD59_18060, partial [Acidimicrobiales bacterium]|nr:hypothetical protein [Acidimicrobiales bacterium]
METYPIDRSDISLAVRLLRKAESTSSDHESAALALRSYSLLAEVINGFEAANGEPRRRDRRLLHDRRARQGEAAGEGRL